jgi:hypothetical protein
MQKKDFWRSRSYAPCVRQRAVRGGRYLPRAWDQRGDVLRLEETVLETAIELTRPAKVYQVEVEKTACVIRLRPVWPAFCGLSGLK